MTGLSEPCDAYTTLLARLAAAEAECLTLRNAAVNADERAEKAEAANKRLEIYGKIADAQVNEIANLQRQVSEFDSCIQRIASELGVCCGGVDGDQTDPFSTTQALLTAIREKSREAGQMRELWLAIKEMEPTLGDANKPLAIAASYALLHNQLQRVKEGLV